MDFLNQLEPLLRTFWFIAIPVTCIFLIQTVMTFMGTDGTEGLEADFDSNLVDAEAPVQIFTLRNLINFLLGFSWTGISFYHVIPNKALLITVAFLVGALFICVFFLVIKQIQKLAEDNSFRFTDTLDKTAEVYLAIPAQRQGKGKVIISVRGAVHELDAMTDNDHIESAAIVKVVKVENGSMLIVEKL